jgi:hypothetical protein
MTMTSSKAQHKLAAPDPAETHPADPLCLAELQALTDFPAHEALILERLDEALSDPAAILRFFGRYASWNGFFGSGVATLSGKIGRARRMFIDPDERITALADRSVFVASFIFDAARDEFDDHETVYRDTHRDLAQALISGLIHYGKHCLDCWHDAGQVNRLLEEPRWLGELNALVATGYGAHQPDVPASLFRAIGYHLGSELLADREFSVIDRRMRATAPALVAFLEQHRERIGAQDHAAYQWIRIHSGGGGAVEADHFAKAAEGADLALRYTPAAERATMRASLHMGFKEFAFHHHQFFTNVNLP